MTLDLHLVRHATHGHLGRVLTGRMSGIGLSAAGRAEAHALAGQFGPDIDAVLTSPRERACETAQILGLRAGVVPRVEPALDEIDFGRWSGQSFAALDADPDWRLWNAERDTARPPGGESMNEVAARLTRLIGTLSTGALGRRIVLVSHADVIKACICKVLGLPFSRLDRFEIAPASVTTLAVRDTLRLIALNWVAPPALAEAAA